MTGSMDPESRAKLEELMAAHGLGLETRLYRETGPEHLTAGEEVGSDRITANPHPSEAVINLYGDGHVWSAEHLGQGLAFAEQDETEWREPGRITVSVRLGDVLQQGGLIYPVESVVTSKVWYLTLPDGAVSVRRDSTRDSP